MLPQRSKDYKYEPLNEEEGHTEASYTTAWNRRASSPVIWLVCLVLGVLGAAITGFFAGQVHTRIRPQDACESYGELPRKPSDAL